MKNTYILKNKDYNGYNQAFSEIGSWEDVLLWASDGSIQPGDIVYKLQKTKKIIIKFKYD